MKTRQRLIVAGLVVAVCIFCQPVLADVKFTRLDETHFVISHQEGGAKGVRVIYRKVGSICIAARYVYFEIEEQGFQKGGATVLVQFHQEAGEDRIECASQAERGMVKKAMKTLAKAKKKLAKKGGGESIDRPEPKDDISAPSTGEESPPQLSPV